MKIDTLVKCPNCGIELNLDNIFAQQSNLYHIIKKIMEIKGDNNFIIITFDIDYYIQIAACQEINELVFETVSNKFLKDDKKLSKTQQSDLIRIGWLPPDNNNDNYYFDVNYSTDKSLIHAIEKVTKTASDIFGIDSINHDMITINLE